MLMEIMYFQDSWKDKSRSIDLIKDAPKYSPFAFTPPFAVPLTLQSRKDGDHPIYQIYYHPISEKMNGITSDSAITLPPKHISEIQLNFPTDLTAELFRQKTTNSLAGALIIDIISSKGTIDRRVCPAFDGVQVEEVFESILYGAIGIEPHILVPHEPEFFCEAVKKN